MKKLLSILLALIMLLTLAACTGKSAVSAPADTTQTGDTRSAEEQASNEDAADAEKPVINWFGVQHSLTRLSPLSLPCRIWRMN